MQFAEFSDWADPNADHAWPSAVEHQCNPHRILRAWSLRRFSPARGSHARTVSQTKWKLTGPGATNHLKECGMNTASGVITLTQEHRFQLVDDQGGKKLFILAHGSPVQGKDLERLESANRRVRVFYSDGDTLNGYTAHDIHEQ